ncbi:hypothetical protein ScPMuIL_004436 [Solemya velum]
MGLKSCSKLIIRRGTGTTLSTGKTCKKIDEGETNLQISNKQPTDGHASCHGGNHDDPESGHREQDRISVPDICDPVDSVADGYRTSTAKVVLSDISNLIGSANNKVDPNEEQEKPMLYNPVSVDWSVGFCTHFNIDIDSTNLVKNEESHALFRATGPPLMIRRVIGDGNCFFRCISRIVTGKQKYYALFRSLVTEFMRSHVRGFGKVFDVKSHLVDSQMHTNRTWATECEIFSAATMLQTTINVYGWRCCPTRHGMQGHEWVPYRPCFKLRTLSRSTEEIYLSNYFNCHFNIVEDVYLHDGDASDDDSEDGRKCWD